LNHDLARIVENLAWELTSWKTLAIRVRRQDVMLGGKAAPIVIDDYRETASGQRRLQTMSLSSGEPRLIDSAVSDGNKCWNLSYGPDGKLMQAIIAKTIAREDNSGASIRPKPLGNLYVGLTPLHEAIQNAQPVGEETVIGRPCDGFRFSGVRLGKIEQDHVYYLDRETSIPLRIEIYRPTTPPGSFTKVALWEAESLDTVGRYHVPMKSKVVVWRPDQSGGSQEMGRLTLAVESIEYDQPIDEAIFRPELGPGVTVIDTIAKTSYKTPPATPTQADPKSTTSTSARPVEAIPRATGRPASQPSASAWESASSWPGCSSGSAA
jgi:hypothetical protein